MRVQLFVTCIVDSLFPQVGEAVVNVLQRLGVEVVFIEAQTCCGQPGYNAGFRAEARRLALNLLDLFEPNTEPLVVPSGSCAAMLVHGYADLFADDPPNLARARAIAARTYEFGQFLVDVLKVDPALVSASSALTGRVAYHGACHLTRGLGVREPAPRLLAAVPGAQVVPFAGSDECCGFGGLFAVKHGDVSAAMLDKKLAHLRASGADTLVSCDMSCLMHLAGALRRDGSPLRCLHLAEVLASDT